VDLKRLELLRNLTFGARVAEDEGDLLETYFVETAQWNKIYNGDVDVVYGAKGSGKSALYSLLLKRKTALFDRTTILVAGENPRGAPAFRDLNDDPPSGESEFILMWKLYFLVLVADALSDYGIKNDKSDELINVLEEAGLRKKERSLAAVIRSILDYVRSWMSPKSIEGGVSVDPSGGLAFKGKITPREMSETHRRPDAYSVDRLLDLADEALRTSKYTIWILLDRLDVAFAENDELEENALRALFRAYRDTGDKLGFGPKIFLRSDIWQRITTKGFREASHITRAESISWETNALLSLIVRRAVQNEKLCMVYGVDPRTISESYEEQEGLFYRIFPYQVDLGEKKPFTIDWMMSRTQDGTKQTAPRELIHLLNSIVQAETRRLEIGQAPPEDERLFSRQAIKDALAPVSKTRLEQTLYAEYPTLKTSIERLDGGKSEHNRESLSEAWSVSETEAAVRAQRLVEVGFFEQRGSKLEPTLWIPFLYRDALNIVQGAAF
jgi:hypothetical protein